MQTKVFESPALYGDHHVPEVRRILLELPGVSDVYASSSFRAIEVTFDESQISAEQITAALDEAGYLGEWKQPVEQGAVTYLENNDRSYFRHTDVYETVKTTVSFTQKVHYEGKPLWPCPGMGVIKGMDEED